MLKQSFRKRYILALAVILVLVTFAQVLVQYNLRHQEQNAEIINLAGRQRMLSQKIAKLLIIASEIKSKDESLVLWQRLEVFL